MEKKRKRGRPELEIAVRESVEELKEKYRDSKCKVESRRIQVVWWLAEGKSRKEVVELSGYSKRQLIAIINRYKEGGLKELRDKRGEGKGAKKLLSDEEMLLFGQIVRKDYEKGVIWNGKKVVEWVKEELGKEIYVSRGYEMLGAIGFSVQRVRPRHVKGDKEKQEGFKKNLLRR